MSPTDTWHLSDDLVARYADMTLAPSGRASVEAHLQGCAACRALVADSPAVSAMAPRIKAGWSRTVDRIDRPRRNWLHRLAAAAGVPDHLVRLVAASTAFRSAWVVSVALVVAAGIAIAHGELGPVPFLLLSPLVPVVGVAAAYAGTNGPADFRAFESATPFGELRLMLVRTTAVTVASILVLALASLLLPSIGVEAVAWLLPALALTATTLALATRLAPERAAGAVAAGWLITLFTVGTLLFHASRSTATDLGALAVPLQLTALVLLVASAATFAVRRHEIELPNR